MHKEWHSPICIHTKIQSLCAVLPLSLFLLLFIIQCFVLFWLLTFVVLSVSFRDVFMTCIFIIYVFCKEMWRFMKNYNLSCYTCTSIRIILTSKSLYFFLAAWKLIIMYRIIRVFIDFWAVYDVLNGNQGWIVWKSDTKI